MLLRVLLIYLQRHRRLVGGTVCFPAEVDNATRMNEWLLVPLEQTIGLGVGELPTQKRVGFQSSQWLSHSPEGLIFGKL